MAKIQDINKPENVARMKFIATEIEKLVLQYRENTEAAIVAGACIQIATRLLVLYPPKVRDGLVEGAVMLLRGETPEDLAAPTLILPKNVSKRKH